MLGELFLPCDTPEAPKLSFFKNLFGPSTNTLDREELCESLFFWLALLIVIIICICSAVGEEGSGKASKTIAKYTAGMANTQDRVAAGCSEIAKAKMVSVSEEGKSKERVVCY